MKLFTVHEVAEMFSVSEKTVRRLIDRAEIGVTYIGRRVFISELDWSEYLERCRVPAKQELADSPDAKRATKKVRPQFDSKWSNLSQLAKRKGQLQ